VPDSRGTCTVVAAGAPAMSTGTLLIAVMLLAVVGGLAVARRRGRTH
jgi:MYXO-CTERM domain-containing protein